MFHVTSDNIDDLMRAVFTRLLSGSRENNKVSSNKGGSTEVFGALLRLTNPRARLGRSVMRSRIYSSIGELIWYLSASNELSQIQHYISAYHQFSDDGRTLNGAYGPRLFASQRISENESPSDEWRRVIDLLKDRRGSRNAVIQIYSNEDGKKNTKDIPCTCTIQFAIRRNKLEMHVHMRSNDVFLGLPHDIFSFTMMQEIAACELNVKMGSYHHSVASLHLYDDSDDPNGVKSRTWAQVYLDEGLHDKVPMPPMPSGDPWPAIRELVRAERDIRQGKDYIAPKWLDLYWRDLITLLQAHAIAVKSGLPETLESLLATLNFEGYRLYILDRIAKRKQPPAVRDFFKGNADDASRST